MNIIRDCQRHSCARKNICNFEDMPAGIVGFFCWGCNKRWVIDLPEEQFDKMYLRLWKQRDCESGSLLHQLVNNKGVAVPVEEESVLDEWWVECKGCRWSSSIYGDGDGRKKCEICIEGDRRVPSLVADIRAEEPA